MASRSINRVVLLGHLGSDASTRFSPNGVARTAFNIATNRVWKDQNGDQKEETDWHNVILWRSENLAAYLTKGKQVYIEGRLITRSYDKDGDRRYITEVIAEEIILLGGGGNGGAKETKPSSSTATPAQRPSGTPGNGQRTSTGTHTRQAGAQRAGTHRQPPPPPDDPEITDDDVPF